MSPEDIKIQGDALLHEGDAAGAVAKYSDALASLSGKTAAQASQTPASPAPAAAAPPLELLLLSNRSLAHLALGSASLALADAERAISLRPRWGKAHARRAAALAGLGRRVEAELAYGAAASLAPELAEDVRTALKRMQIEEMQRSSALAEAPGLGACYGIAVQGRVELDDEDGAACEARRTLVAVGSTQGGLSVLEVETSGEDSTPSPSSKPSAPFPPKSPWISAKTVFVHAPSDAQRAPLHALEWSTCGSYLATATLDGGLSMWKPCGGPEAPSVGATTSGAVSKWEETVLESPATLSAGGKVPSRATRLTFLPDGVLVCGSTNGSLATWAWRSQGWEKEIVDSGPDSLTALSCRHRTIAAAWRDGTFSVWRRQGKATGGHTNADEWVCVARHVQWESGPVLHCQIMEVQPVARQGQGGAKCPLAPSLLLLTSHYHVERREGRLALWALESERGGGGGNGWNQGKLVAPLSSVDDIRSRIVALAARPSGCRFSNLLAAMVCADGSLRAFAVVPGSSLLRPDRRGKDGASGAKSWALSPLYSASLLAPGQASVSAYGTRAEDHAAVAGGAALLMLGRDDRACWGAWWGAGGVLRVLSLEEGEQMGPSLSLGGGNALAVLGRDWLLAAGRDGVVRGWHPLQSD